MKYTIKILAIVTCCLLVQASFAQEKFKDLRVIVKNEVGVNSPNLDYSPAFYNGGLVFISNQNPGLKYARKDASGFYDSKKKFTSSIYESKRAENGVLGDPFLFAEDITTTYHEGPVSFSKDEKVIYFTRNNFIKTKRGKASNGVTKLKLYTAEKIGGYWTNEKEISELNSDEYNTCHPSISSDGKKLYFASDRSGGQGGLDIYVTNLKSDGTWDKPEAVTDINTAKSDAFPFVHNNGTLFFASNGYHDNKDYDIFYTDKKDDVWRIPVNLVPFNTEYDDFGFVLDPQKQHGFFTSNRPEGMGEDDIYSFTIDGYLSINDDLDGLPITLGEGEKSENCDVKLIVTDKVTGEKIPGAKVDYTTLSNISLAKSLIDDGDGNLVEIVAINEAKNEYLLRLRFDESEDAQSAMTDAQGEFGNKVGCEEYVFRVFKEGYSPRQVVYSPNGENEINVVLSRLVNSLNVDGSVVNPSTKVGISSASVTIIDDLTKEVQTIPTDKDGNFIFEGKCNHTYTVIAEKSGIKSGSATYKINPDCTKGKDLVLEIETIMVDEGGFNTGDIIYLPSIYYDFDKSTIRSDATEDLDGLAAILLQFTNLDIELSSHTDSRGNKNYNRQLSQSRANAAKSYLVSKGVAAARIKGVGYGEDQLKNQCVDNVNCTEEEHQYNRRTEVKVTSTNSSLQFRSKNNPPRIIDTRN